MTKDEALDLALEALEKLKRAFFKRASTAKEIEQGCDRGYEDYEAEFVEPALKAITAIKQARALDKKAENARELGLDYEPVPGNFMDALRFDVAMRDAAQPAPVQSCYCPNCEAMGKELAALKAQPAPVQEPVAVTYKEVADTMNALWGGTLKQVQIAMELANKKLYATPPAAQPAPVQPVEFLANGARFKISYDSRQSGGQIHGIPPELGGRWVAFVAAEDDCHLKLTTPPAAPVPLTDEQIDAEFEVFASKFDHESNEWLDMGVDEYFRAGCRAAAPAQPAVPDAIHHTDLSEHPQYIEGWNDCRAEMLKGMK
jgi:hypothetical protein